MKVIKAKYQHIMEKSPILKIERIARACYKSEELIGPGTAEKMVGKLVERKHWAMLEHASLTYIVTKELYRYIRAMVDDLQEEFYSDDVTEVKPINRLRFTEYAPESRHVITGNLRAWLEFFEHAVQFEKEDISIMSKLMNEIFKDSNCIVDFREYASNVEEDNCTLVTDYSVLSGTERMVHESFSILFTVDRGVTHELVRMRDCSFAQESTRYCNYSNGKYGNEITVIEPCFWEPGTLPYVTWETSCQFAEKQYIMLTEDLKEPAQRARDVLPTSVKADIVVTTYLDEWRHIFNLRACDATGPAHPQMKEVMVPLLLDVKPVYEFAFGDLNP